ncbi:hypothetical protein P7D22_14770 [Lichenihabitans sp. Uapishka_5]|uniref:hypothetical protein n=1 Tax=Lichenihabitans sp. Uapishka_5 TaxID=3037302 RepID=UPI0029E80925|nr:hypothetical protein [Lichenihabitans sp. Uapishka_5]MDX7952431.1 hypothetical protein [Lichenihabitans sp. Uapishka_5]
MAFERGAARPAKVDYRFRTGRPLVAGSRYSAPVHAWQLPPIATEICAFRPKWLKSIVARASEAKTIVDVRAALRSGSRARFDREAD